uniref:t-SNARE coiled-coil homology domain-containing protein n=1 Tax=Rhabditophanes sp. KR3021 TaxID=114890 RepID=A0AC35TVW8_9BILA
MQRECNLNQLLGLVFFQVPIPVQLTDHMNSISEEIAAVKELLGKNKEQPDLILNLQQANHDLVKENIDLKATNTTFENRALIAERKIIDSVDEVKVNSILLLTVSIHILVTPGIHKQA